MIHYGSTTETPWKHHKVTTGPLRTHDGRTIDLPWIYHRDIMMGTP